MTAALGLLLGAGVLLALSPLLWPAVSKPGLAHPNRLAASLASNLAAAGLAGVRVATVVLVSVILAATVGTVVFALAPVVPLAFAAGAAALVVPAVLISVRAKARRRATRQLWPDVVDQLVSAVRAGQSLPDSVASLEHSGPTQTREPFAEFAGNYRATANFGLAVSELKDRLADPVADRILETLRMSREVGGSELTLVLRNLAAYLRQEAAVRSEVEARQSWVVNAARLGVAAPWIVLMLLSTRPEAAAAYNTTAGAVLVLVGLGVSVVAYRVMLAIGKLPPERRWFE